MIYTDFIQLIFKGCQVTELKIVEFRGVGGLQGRQEAKDQAIYDNFQAIHNYLNSLDSKCKKGGK